MTVRNLRKIRTVCKDALTSSRAARRRFGGHWSNAPRLPWHVRILCSDSHIGFIGGLHVVLARTDPICLCHLADPRHCCGGQHLRAIPSFTQHPLWLMTAAYVVLGLGCLL